MKKTYLNPYTMYAIAWLSVFFIYSLGWSDLYPPFSTELTTFFLVTISITGIFGLLLSYKGAFIYKPIKYDLDQVKKLSLISIVVNTLDVAYSGYIPLISIVRGSHADDGNFGLPMLHPLIITFGIFLGLYVFHMMMSTDKVGKRKLLPYFLLSFLAVIIIFGRGLMFMTIFGCALIYVMGHQIKGQVITILLVSGFAILYLFGWTGNLRIGEDGVKITTIGQATEKFEKSVVPEEFFWSYIYFSSPMANLEHNLIVDKYHSVDEGVIGHLLVSEIVPQFISNKFLPDDKKAEPELITKALNVSSVYARSYTIAGWTGIWIMFAYIFIYTFIIFSIIPKTSPYFIVSLVVVNMLMIGNVFDNMMNYVLSYTVFFPMFFVLKERFKITFTRAKN